MISLRRYLEAAPEELLKSLRDSYRASLAAMGESALRICPHLSAGFRRNLLNLRDSLAPDASAAAVAETGTQVETELDGWARTASEYFQDTARDVREIMLIVAQTTTLVGARDQRYASQLKDLSGQLTEIAQMEDLPQLRRSLAVSVLQIRTCVNQMVQEGQEELARLRRELAVYEDRVNEAERIATEDPVTALANRYKVERQIRLRIESGRGFSIALFDLNDFTRINDSYGRSAGDSLLKQFAAELKNIFRPADIVSRWGGDEFLVVVDSGYEELSERIAAARQWVYGDYVIWVNGVSQNVKVAASVGLAFWKQGEDADALIGRADAALAREKEKWRAGGPKSQAAASVPGRAP